MDKNQEKTIQEFERLERIAIRIVTKNKVTWGDFVISTFSIMVDVSIKIYAMSIMDCKKELRIGLAYVLSKMDNYYGSKKKD